MVEYLINQTKYENLEVKLVPHINSDKFISGILSYSNNKLVFTYVKNLMFETESFILNDRNVKDYYIDSNGTINIIVG